MRGNIRIAVPFVLVPLLLSLLTWGGQSAAQSSPPQITGQIITEAPVRELISDTHSADVFFWGQSYTVGIIDSFTDTVQEFVGNLPISADCCSRSIAVDGERKRLYLTGAAEVGVWNIATRSYSGYFPVTQPKSIAVDAATGYVYTVSAGGQLLVFNGETMQQVGAYDGYAGSFSYIAALNSASKKLYVTYQDEVTRLNDIRVFDISTPSPTKVKDIVLGGNGSNRVGVHIASNTLYIVSSYTLRVTVIDGQVDEIVATVPYGEQFPNTSCSSRAPQDVTVDQQSGRVYISSITTTYPLPCTLNGTPDYAVNLETLEKSVSSGNYVVVEALADYREIEPYRPNDHRLTFNSFTGKLYTFVETYNTNEPRKLITVIQAAPATPPTPTPPPVPSRVVSGTVLDPNGDPIGGVSISISPGGVTATSDPEGAYSVSNLPVGPVQISGSHPNFNFQSSVEVTIGTQPVVAPYLLGTRRPLIFIPGIMGSYLDQREGTGPLARVCNLWPGLPRAECPQQPGKNPALAMPGPVGAPPIYATYAITEIRAPRQLPLAPFTQNIYAPLIDRLEQPRRLGGGGYSDFGSSDITPLQRCEGSLTSRRTTLFVFAYDWRKDIAETAKELEQLIECARAVHGGSKVDIVTHSMGGLVARRYITERKEQNHVNRLITIAAPWLGAPRVLPILTTGWYDSNVNLLISPKDLRAIGPTMPGVWQLAPSPYYFDLVPPEQRPLVERGRDLDGDLWPWETQDNLEYSPTMEWLEDQVEKPVYGLRYNLSFHTAVQDDFRSATYGVRYFHIYGVEKIANTLQSLVAVNKRGCLRYETLPFGAVRCEWIKGFEPKYTFGDGTVPQVSAARQSALGNLNAPNATVLQILGGYGDNGDVTHTGLASNDSVITAVLAELARRGVVSTPQASLQVEPQPQLAYYLDIYGTGGITIRDGAGNSTDTVSDTLTTAVPNITYTPLSDQQQVVVFPATESYTVTFRAGSDPISIDLTRGDGVTANNAVRYLDISVPTNSGLQLRITPQAATSLHIDADADGVFEQTIPPTAVASGVAAADITAPVLTITRSGPVSSSRITLNAVDEGSGVKQVLYSLDGTTFHIYREPFEVDATHTPVLYVFGDDNNANRSSTLLTRLVEQSYLPMVRR